MQLNTVMAEKHGFPLALVYQENGFVFTLKKDELEGELPSDFINVTSQKGRWYFSSMELKKMNARMKDALDEALLLSNKIIQDLVEQILAYSGALYAASEAVAIIDLLWSFAHTSISKSLFLSRVLLITMISEKLRAPGVHWDVCREGRKAPNS